MNKKTESPRQPTPRFAGLLARLGPGDWAEMIRNVSSIIDDVSSGQWVKAVTESVFIVAALWELKLRGSVPTRGQRPHEDPGRPPAQ